MMSTEIYQGTLFADEGATAVRYRPAAPRAGIKGQGVTTWSFSDHACRHCFGRVMQRAWRGKVFEVRCAECSARQFGDVTGLCCCGADCGALGRALECFKNPEISPTVPQEIMVRERAERLG
jgi:hypothetical protein